MKNIKKVIGSALIATAFAATSVGTTFALFTDEAKTTITVESGRVEIERTVTLLRYESSVDGKNVEIENNSYSNQDVGNSFSISNTGEIVISKMVPGDKLTLSATATNKSNVKTKIRYRMSHTLETGKEDLFPALVFGFKKNGTDADVADLFKWQVTNPSSTTSGTQMDELTITIELPNTDNLITAREEGIDNQYQDCACIISFDLQAVQGNASTAPIDDINAYLLYKGLTPEGKNATMHDALDDAGELDYSIADIPTGYVYDLANDQFILESAVDSRPHYEFFKIYNSVPSQLEYSIYAGSDWNTAIVEVDGVGFDAGDTTNVATISYTDTGSAKTNIIRTNSFDTAVTIDAEHDVVKHYGNAQSVNIIAVAGHSYFENGSVVVARIATGRIVLTEEADVAGIYLVANAQDKFDDIKLAVVGDATLPTLARADVTVDQEPILVLEVQKLEEEDSAVTNSEFVWLTPAGETQVTSDEEGEVIVESSEVAQQVEEEIKENREMRAISTLTELKAFINNANNGAIDNPLGLIAGVEIQFDSELELKKSMILKGSSDTVFKGYDVTDDYCEAFFVNTKNNNDVTITLESIEFDHFGYYSNVEEEIVASRQITSYITYSGNCTASTVLNISDCSFIGTGRDMINASSTLGCAGEINITDCVFDAEDRASSTLNMVSLFGKNNSVLDVTIDNCIFSEADEENEKWATTAVASFGNCDLTVDGCTFISCQVAIAADNIFWELNGISASEVTHNTDALIIDVEYVDCKFGYFFQGFVNSVEGIDCVYDADYTIAGHLVGEYDYVEMGEYGVTAKYLTVKCYYLLKD